MFVMDGDPFVFQHFQFGVENFNLRNQRLMRHGWSAKEVRRPYSCPKQYCQEGTDCFRIPLIPSIMRSIFQVPDPSG